jgi:nicotinate-nucleotide pyrophosphorylase (carboxylating)
MLSFHGDRTAVGDDCEPPIQAVREAVARALAEDVLPMGDLSAGLVPAGIERSAVFAARVGGVVAGTACLSAAAEAVDPRLVVDLEVRDGAAIAAGVRIGTVRGPFRSLLTAERTMLNFLCHLSGVASATRRFVDAVHAVDPAVAVLDTRKTTPGLRALEKAAVRAGGGTNHRGSLSEGVLIKDNHLGAIGIGEAVALAAARWPGRMIEVECDRLDQVEAAVEAGAAMVLCDNMAPETLAEAIRIARRRPGRACLVEASGEMALDTVAAYAAVGPDFISVGAITHSAPVLDIGLDLEPS